MAAAKFIKVKFLKRHPHFAYAEGQEGLVKEAMLKKLKLVENGTVELVKPAKKEPAKKKKAE